LEPETESMQGTLLSDRRLKLSKTKIKLKIIVNKKCETKD
jgi:hypothetical protein